MINCHIIPIYDVPFVFVYEEDYKSTLKAIKKFSTRKDINRPYMWGAFQESVDEEDFNDAYGVTYCTIKDNSAFITIAVHKRVAKNGDTHDVIGHEVSHAVDRILHTISGAPFCIENTEPRAYLAGYLHKYIYNLLDTKKKTSRK
jgi:effector-binding domain-containing protein